MTASVGFGDKQFLRGYFLRCKEYHFSAGDRTRYLSGFRLEFHCSVTVIFRGYANSS